MHENFSLPFRRRLCHPSGAMIHAKLTQFALPLSLAGLLLVAGCNKNQSPQNAEQPAASQPAPASSPEASTPAAPTAAAPAPANTPPPPPPQPVSYTIPAGTRVTVRLGQTLSSKTANEGDAFDATVTSPITVKGKTLVSTGSAASGTVTASNARGKFKGEGVLSLRLTSLRIAGTPTPIDSSTWNRTLKGKGKRTAGFVGGGAGAGALIGGLAGGRQGRAYWRPGWRRRRYGSRRFHRQRAGHGWRRIAVDLQSRKPGHGACHAETAGRSACAVIES